MKIRMYNVAYFFRLAFQGIFRNGLMSFFSAVLLITSLLFTGSSYLVKKNADYNLEELNDYNKIIVFLEKDTDSLTAEVIMQKIEKLESVEKVELRTKDDVLKGILEEYGDYSDILQMYGDDNPCKDEVIITYSDPSKVNTIVYKIENMNSQEDTINSIAKINDRRDVAEKIEKISDLVSFVMAWIVVICLFFTGFLIFNTVKLAINSRRDEVYIMRYVGASAFFVSFPFVLEGIILGLFSSGVALGIQYGLYRLLADVIGTSGLVTVLPFSSLIGIVIAGFLAIGVGLGIIGSLIALKKYKRA